jgi:hypothetical protein
MSATGLFLRFCPDAAVRTLGYDPEGRPEAAVDGPLSPRQVRLAVLSHALAFAGQSTGVCPLVLDDPLEGVGPEGHGELFMTMLDALPSRQIVILLSDPGDIATLRSTGRVDKELEIRG